MTSDEENMLDELLNEEVNFIESLSNQREQKLTEKQSSKLESVWSKVFGSYDYDPICDPPDWREYI